jgi:hypothetical protein
MPDCSERKTYDLELSSKYSSVLFSKIVYREMRNKAATGISLIQTAKGFIYEKIT